jgi:hypothetical protein
LSFATSLLIIQANLIAEHIRQEMEQLWAERREAFEEAVLKFLSSEITPTAMFDFETELAGQTRELGRQVMEHVLNQVEPDDPQQMPHDVEYHNGGYRRLNEKTRNAHVGTTFGTIDLWRYPYRYWHRDISEPCIFPLERQLGLMQGATPALADAVGRYMAQAGATQQSVLDRLKPQHGISWGAGRLRDLTAELAESFGDLTQEFQVRRLLELLEKAEQSRGRCRPVLSAGRDGVTLRDYRYGFFENATAATVTVYDRSGKRLGTVYLAFAPEQGQQQMTARLTALIEELLRRWQGPLPRLTYVTDAGDYETRYYRDVLRKMRHPCTRKKLHWVRILDYYHASQRIWTIAEALFGKDNEHGRAWARRMCRSLKKPSGPSRVLHSAGAMRARLPKLSKSGAEEYRKACAYLRRRTKLMQYHEYQRVNLPIGSGVTEAACKTVVAQRLKLSGMRWMKKNAQTILNLRVVFLSGIWQPLYREFLERSEPKALRTYGPMPESTAQNVA